MASRAESPIRNPERETRQAPLIHLAAEPAYRESRADRGKVKADGLAPGSRRRPRDRVPDRWLPGRLPGRGLRWRLAGRPGCADDARRGAWLRYPRFRGPGRSSRDRNMCSPKQRGQCLRGLPLGATPGGFDRDQLVLHIVQLHQAGLLLGVFELERYRFENVTTKLPPGLRLGKDGMTQGAGAVATILRVADFEDQLHVHRIPEAGAQCGCAWWRWRWQRLRLCSRA